MKKINRLHKYFLQLMDINSDEIYKNNDFKIGKMNGKKIELNNSTEKHLNL